MSCHLKIMNPQMTPYLKEKCLNIVKEFLKAKVFFEFRNRVPRDVQNYYSTIKHPMCLTDLKRNLDNDKYKTLDDFKYDMNLIWSNCIEFNGEHSTLGHLANLGQHRMNLIFENFPITKEEEFLKKLRQSVERLQLYNQFFQKELDHTPTNYTKK